MAFFNILICFCDFRDLDARAKSERYRALFRLPKDEKLDGHTDCTLWTPFNKMHILGQMFVSTNYICFTSKEETTCSLIIPLREVKHRKQSSSYHAFSTIFHNAVSPWSIKTYLIIALCGSKMSCILHRSSPGDHRGES